MALSQGLHHKLLQKLSPQQIQLMKLLQIPTAYLDERIKEEIEENPALEQGSEDEADGLGDEIKDEFDSSNEEEFENDGSEMNMKTLMSIFYLAMSIVNIIL